MPARLLTWLDDLRRRESQLALVLSLVIGALVGLVVVAFILLTGRLAARLYPALGGGTYGIGAGCSGVGVLLCLWLGRRWRGGSTSMRMGIPAADPRSP